MDLSEFCKGEVVTITQGQTILEAAVLMRERSVGCLIITHSDGSGVPVGVLTDRDIVSRGVAQMLPVDSMPVSSIMSVSPVTVAATEDVREVIKLMGHHRVRRIIIVDASGAPIGIVSTDDLLKVLANDLNLLGELIQVQTGTRSRHRTHEFTRMA